jgi:hypothetical protein
MIILKPKKLLNRFYHKGRPKWQERYDNRLALLKFIGYKFWKPEDWAFVGPAPPEIMKSVSAFPYGIFSAAMSTGNPDTLALGTLISTNDDFDTIVSAGIRFRRDGYVDRINALGNWSNVNPTTDWIDNKTSTVGDDYDCLYDETAGFDGVYSGGWTDNSWQQISSTQTCRVDASCEQFLQSSGTAKVRERANHSNEVTASVTINAQNLSIC